MSFVKYPKQSGAKRGENNPRFGVTVSKETRQKISIAHKGRKRGVMSEEHKKKLSETHKRIGNRPPKQNDTSHWNWKDGISSLHSLIRASKEYKLWRKAVFERDNYTCIFCKSRNGNGKRIIFNADHIKPFAH